METLFFPHSPQRVHGPSLKTSDWGNDSSSVMKAFSYRKGYAEKF